MLFGRKSASESAPDAATAGPTQVSTPTALRSDSATPVHKQLGQLLIDEGLITSGQLEKALEEQAKTNGFLGQILVKQGSVTQAAVSSCLVKQCKIPHLNLLDYEISPDVLSLLPEAVCKKYHLLPIDKLGRILTVAMVDPLDNEALQVIREHCGELKIKPILCNWEHYDLVSAKVWGGTSERSGGAHQMTTESLGLSKLPPAVKNVDRTPTPLPAAPAPAPQPTAQPTSAASPTISARDLSAAMREAMQDVVKVIAAQQPAPAATPGISGEDISAAIRGAMQEAVQSLAAVAQPTAQPTPVVATPDLSGLGEVLRSSVQEAMSSVAQELRSTISAPQTVAPVATPAQASISPEQMAAVIQDSVGGAMQEAMAVLVTQLKALSPRRDDNPGLSAEVLAAAVRDSVRDAIAGTLAVQQQQGERLAEIAEATLQSVQQNALALESSAVRQNIEQDLLRPPTGRHASVSAFRGGASGTMDHDHKVAEALESNRPAESMSFGNFVPGSMNAFTYRISQEVAKNPGGDFNPFFLFGHVGAGKTHLISAIGNQILQASPTARVGYVSASHFARRLKEAMAENALESFREHYAHWDVLILDDIQFLAGRVEAQEEFFHIFNALHAQGRQIIIASDKAPDRLGLLEQRLISRFGSGIVAELKAPEWEARMTILRQQAQQAGVKVPEQVLSLIAMRVADDVRKMCGSLRKVIAFAQLGGGELNCELAEQILSHLGSEVAA